MYDLMDYDEVLEKFEPVMGMEVHVELNTETKMFSTSPTNFNAAPNSNVDPVSLGLPGALPVVNSKGVEGAIKIGLAPCMWVPPKLPVHLRVRKRSRQCWPLSTTAPALTSA